MLCLGPSNEMVNVSYQEESWFVLLQKFDKNSDLDKTYFCVTEAAGLRLWKSFQTHDDPEKYIEKKHHMIWPGLG